MNGENWFVVFYFDNDGLDRVLLTIVPHTSDHKVRLLLQALKEKYGQPKDIEEHQCAWLNDFLRTESYIYRWVKHKTNIEYDWRSYCDGEPYPTLIYSRGPEQTERRL